MTVDEMIEVLNAFKAGKKIQFRCKSLDGSICNWCDLSHEPVWDFGEYDYRVKREPSEIWVVHTKFGMAAYKNRRDAEMCHITTKEKMTHYREVEE